MYDNTFISVAGDPRSRFEVHRPRASHVGLGRQHMDSHQPIQRLLSRGPARRRSSSTTSSSPNRPPSGKCLPSPGFQLNVSRPIFIATPGNQTSLRETIQAALQQTGNRPVIYFPSGKRPSYYIYVDMLK